MKFKTKLISKTMKPGDPPTDFNVIDGVTGFSEHRVAIYAEGIMRPLIVLDRAVYDRIATAVPDEVISLIPEHLQKQGTVNVKAGLQTAGALAQKAPIEQTQEMAIHAATEVISHAKRKSKVKSAPAPETDDWDSGPEPH